MHPRISLKIHQQIEEGKKQIRNHWKVYFYFVSKIPQRMILGFFLGIFTELSKDCWKVSRRDFSEDMSRNFSGNIWILLQIIFCQTEKRIFRFSLELVVGIPLRFFQRYSLKISTIFSVGTPLILSAPTKELHPLILLQELVEKSQSSFCKIFLNHSKYFSEITFRNFFMNSPKRFLQDYSQSFRCPLKNSRKCSLWYPRTIQEYSWMHCIENWFRFFFFNQWSRNYI